MARRLFPTVAVLLLACSGSTDPEALGTFAEERVYVLRQMAGEALPGISTSPGGTIQIDADTLRLKPDGTATKVTHVVVSQVGREPIEERWEARMTYGLRGNRIEVSYVCPPYWISSCVAPPHFRGSLSGTTLRLDRAEETPTPFEYEWVRGSD